MPPGWDPANVSLPLRPFLTVFRMVLVPSYVVPCIGRNMSDMKFAPVSAFRGAAPAPSDQRGGAQTLWRFALASKRHSADLPTPNRLALRPCVALLRRPRGPDLIGRGGVPCCAYHRCTRLGRDSFPLRPSALRPVDGRRQELESLMYSSAYRHHPAPRPS